MTRTRWLTLRERLLSPLLPLFLVVLLVGGCATDSAADEPASNDGGPASTGHAAARAEPAGRTVRVGLIEWSIELSTTTVDPGRLRLRVTNAGATEHQLTVVGRRGTWHSPDIPPGRMVVLHVRAVPGERLRLSSFEPGQLHPMRAALRVADGAA